MQVVRKLISLSETVAEELDKEKNMSALVDVLLGEFYGVEVVEGGRGGPERDEVKARLLGDVDVVQPAESDPVPTPIPVTVAATDPVAELATPAPDTSEAPVSAPEAEPVVEELLAPIVEAGGATDPGLAASEDPLALAREAEPPVEAAPTPQKEPTDNPPALDNVSGSLPINVDGQPGGQCPIHGLFVGPLCIDCL